MSDTPIGQVLQFGYTGDDVPGLLRTVAEGIDQLGPDVRILDLVVRPDKLTAEIYFLRTD